MSARNYAILWVGAHSGGGGAFGTALGGNALTKTPPHKLDGPEHLTADDTTLLDATATQHGLLPKLSGSSGDVLRGDGTFGAASVVPSFGVPSIALGSSAAAGAASTVIRSDSTIAAFDATAPVTQAFSDVAATGSAAFAARRDHTHGMPAAPATSSSSTGQLLIADTPSTPLVFADLIQTEAQDDLLYADT